MLKPLRALIDDIRRTFGDIHRHTLVVLIASPILLTWLEFFANRHTMLKWFGDEPLGARTDLEVRLLGWEWWSLNGLMVFVVVPMLLVKIVMRDDLRNFGLTLPDARKHAAIGVGLYLLVLPVIVSAARTDTFQRAYPLFDEARTSVALLLQWWIIYLPQFFAVEFFFRGFMLFGLERQIGSAAIFVSALPYCMVHFHKPMAEAFGAIVAGIALGYVALRTRCIWSGFLVHIMVALTMDILAVILTRSA